MPSEADLAQFIRSTFRSVWTLELLLHLRRAGRPLSRAELLEELRASESVVATATATLFSVGLVVIEEEAHVRYAPASPDLDAFVGRTASFYAQKPDAVRRLIINAVSDPAAAFSDAFRFRRE